MLELVKEYRYFGTGVWHPAVAIGFVVFALATSAAQDSPSETPPTSTRTSMIQLAKFGSESSLSIAGTARGQLTDATGPNRIRRITLEQVKRSVDPIASPLARLGQLSIDAAKQHRLGVQADYFPKFSATFANLHFTQFLGEVLSIRHPIGGPLAQIPVPILSQNQTIAALTFIQPITPLFVVNQAVRIARADERIAIAKAGFSAATNRRKSEIEEAYFKLLIAQRRLTSAELNVKSIENRPQYASASIKVVRAAGQEQELVEAKRAVGTAATEVRELTAYLNGAMGWPEDTELELVVPEPLVENISLDDVSDKSTVGNLDVIEAEQTVVKARAASTISKLEYVPTVVAVSGYLFQNALPLVPSNFGYGGVMASYNLFDFGKRERAVKEARAKLGMAEIALQMTKAKIAADVKKSYFELEHSRRLSQMAQKMGSSVAVLMNVSSNSESIDVKAAGAEVEMEMLKADLAHRQAFACLNALMGPPQ
jgi:outer membrane protein